MIVIACNTVSATCLNELREQHRDIPVLGIISPAAHEVAKRCTNKNSVGIIGTKVTTASGAYRDKILSFNPELSISDAACPVFVPLIEEGIIENDIMDLSIRYYLDHFLTYNNVDTLVLGCTHYPLIRKNIEKLYPKLDIIDPSEEVIRSITDALTSRDLFAQQPMAANTFYASDLSENFINMINRIFRNTGFTVAFKNFDLL
jgi:glutamate racemase